jgi:threonylcarbamoyladenosine tRNA methylthiotransferase MtaB
MNVFLTYLGCRLNESEIEELAWRFAEDGHTMVADPAQADLCVVNTCTVTGEAGRKSRQVVRRLARRNPDAQIAVTGCHATVAPEDVARLPNVAWVVSNADKERLVELVAPGDGLPFEPEPVLRHLGPAALGRTRAFVKVQDGCDNRCTFCITTIARGAGRSRPLEQVVAEVQRLVALGYREVVLSGVHLGSYGHDFGGADGLFGLVGALLERTEIPRLRLSSLEPWDQSPGFFDLWADPRLCRQLHLPLQSGCDATLRRMGRRTKSAEFAELVAAAHDRIPDLALTSDIIVGFPGESEAEFKASYRFVEQMAFARLHVFSYSPRPGTAAARLPDPVSVEAKAARSRSMRHLGARQVNAFHERFLGRTLPVLWENGRGERTWRGLTDNYLSVTTASADQLANRITQTRLVEVVGQALRGEVISDALI